MSATTPATWLTARISAARWRSDCGKIEVKSESNEKNTLVAIVAISISQSTAFFAMMRAD